MNQVKRLFLVISVGALLGAVGFAWFSPQVIQWYFSPPTEISVSCTPVVEWSIRAYRKVIFTGALLGAIVSGIFFFAFGNVRQKQAPPQSKGSEPDGFGR